MPRFVPPPLQYEAEHIHVAALPRLAEPFGFDAPMMTAGPTQQTRAFSPEAGALSAAPPGTERSLADTLDRVLRHPADKVALVLHMSRLSLPAPHPHHLRVAHALMQDCAQRFNGQVMTLPTQDMALVATMPRALSGAELAASPWQLRETFLRLFASDMPETGELTSFWRLDEEPRGFGEFLASASGAAATARSEPRHRRRYRPARAA